VIAARLAAAVDPAALAAAVGAAEPRTAGPFAVAAGADAALLATGDITVAFEGRLTNRARLATELGVDAHPCAILAAGWARWGEGVVARCEGPLAVVVWDARQNTGVVARDALGHHSVYVHTAGGLTLATEVAPLLRLLPRRPAPDDVAVAHWLTRRPLPGTRTLFAGVTRLAPGHLAMLTPDGAGAPRRWWHAPGTGPLITDEHRASAHLRSAMQSAVGRALGDAQRPAVLLSGGFDSGSVAALAAPARPATFSGVFPAHPEIDEAENIAASRAAHGLPGHEHPYAPASALAPALDFLALHALPPASPNAFIWRPVLRAAATAGHDALLDGEGGDELFGCSPWLIADALRAGRPDRALHLASRLPGMGEHPRPRWLVRALARYGVRGALPPRLHRRLRDARGRATETVPGWLRPATAKHLTGDDPWAWKATPGPRWRAGLVGAIVDGSEAMGAHEQLRREARLSGIAFRHPFRDPELLAAVLAIDPALMFDPRVDRPLARRAMAGIVPDAVRLSDRKPHFDRLLAEALAGPDRALATTLLGDDALVAEHVELAPLRAGLDPDAPPRAAARLWRVLTLECWLRAAEGRTVHV
jgi:asparagine synthase (glutamine-hydrolysing)